MRECLKKDQENKNDASKNKDLSNDEKCKSFNNNLYHKIKE